MPDIIKKMMDDGASTRIVAIAAGLILLVWFIIKRQRKPEGWLRLSAARACTSGASELAQVPRTVWTRPEAMDEAEVARMNPLQRLREDAEVTGVYDWNIKTPVWAVPEELLVLAGKPRGAPSTAMRSATERPRASSPPRPTRPRLLKPK